MTDRTAFRTTATASDGRGFRTSIVLASDLHGPWSQESCDEHCRRQGLPTRALSLTAEEAAYLEANPAARFGYAPAAGDVTTPFQPRPWLTANVLAIPGYPDDIADDRAACEALAATLRTLEA